MHPPDNYDDLVPSLDKLASAELHHALTHIDFSQISREDFYVEDREHKDIGPITLIIPKKNKFKWEWTELHLRSMVCRRDGLPISVGFPKFFNRGENGTSDQLMDTAFRKDGIYFLSTKLDGSLIIRSVVDGKVYWRTRGSHELGIFEEPVMQLVRERHPELLDPTLTFGPGTSLLFEYTAPANQIVLRYEEAKLWGLALTGYEAGVIRVFPFPWDLPVSNIEVPLSCPKLDTVEAINAQLAGLEREEGYVIWAQLGSGGYHLTKMKTVWYLKLHALRSDATPKFVREYCYRKGLGWDASLNAFKNELEADGFDWELVSYLEPIFTAVRAQFKSVEFRCCEVFDRILKYGVCDMPTRKEQALACKTICEGLGYPDLFSYAIMRATKDHAKANDLKTAMMLDMGINEFKHQKRIWEAGGL